MAAATARAPAADKRWGFAAASAAAAPTRTPAVGVIETAAPKPTNQSTQRNGCRGAFPWGNRPMPPAPNAWASSALLPLKNDGGSGSFTNISDRPSSRGSSGMSTDGSDLLDSPVARAAGQTSHISTAATSHSQRTELRSGSWQFPHSQTSFTDVLKAPFKIIAKRRPTSHGKGFALSADDFPVLVSKNSQSNSQLGHSFQGRPTFSSVIMEARDEQRKVPTTGHPVSTTNFSMEAQQAQLHAIQTPDVCLPPPSIDYWHPPPDHPPDSDRNGIWHGGAALYGPCKPADTPGSFPVESSTHNGQSLLQGGEARHGPVHGGYHPENNDFCYAHVPDDACVKGLPHLMLRKVEDNHSDALEKQIIKKDVALLEKIKLLNIKARNIRAGNMSGISSCRKSKVEHPKSMDVVADDVANAVPVNAGINDITSSFDMANHVSESSNHMSANLVMIDLPEGHATNFSEARKPGKDAANHVNGVGDTLRNKRGSSATDTASNIWGHGWEEHSTADSLPVAMSNTHEDQPFSGNGSQQVHMRTTDDMLNSPDYQIKNSVRELSAHHAKQLHEKERGRIGQKAKSIAKLEDLEKHPFVQSQRSSDMPGKSYHAYRDGNASRNRDGSFGEDISSSISGHGWEDHPTARSFSVMTNTHQDLSFSWNTSRTVQARTADFINSSDYEIQHSRRELSAQQEKQLQEEERGKTQQKEKSIVKLEDLNTLVQSQKSNGTPGKSADSHEYGGWNASRNKHGDSAEDISFNISGHGWEDHPAAESLPVMISSQQGQSVPWNTSPLVYAGSTDNSPGYGIEHSRWRGSSAQHAKKLQERENIQQKAASISKPANFNRYPFVHSQKPNDTPGRSDYHEYGGWHASRNRHGSSAEDVPFNMPGHGWEDHPTVKQESISRVCTQASDIADANKGPLIDNVIPSAKNTDINIIHIDQKGASESHDHTAPMRLQMDKGRKVYSQGRISRGLPASESAGVNEGFLTHDVMPSSKNNGINMTERFAWKSASQSHENNGPEHLQMGIRRRQVCSEEGVLRERSNIAESTENITTISGTLVDTQNAETKPHADLSTQSKNRRPASPLVFGTKNTEASKVHKVHISGVVISNAIIPVQVSSIRGFTVGSIMLGDASLASVNQEEKTVAKEVNDDATHSSSSPKQTKQSGTNQHDVQHVDPHGSGDSIMHTTVKKPSKKEHSEVGGLNCRTIPAPTQPSGNQSIVSQNVAPVKTSEAERHAQKPAYKELDLQNPRQILPAENPTISSVNSSESKLDTKTLDKEALDAPTALKAEVKTEPENREDEKTDKHLERSSAGLNHGSTNGSGSAAPDLNEQEANSVFKMMQGLSDLSGKVEKELESSTNAATVNLPQPAQMVSLPGYTWGEHNVSQGYRQYHVNGQGNMWVNYAANSHLDGAVMAQGPALLTTHLLPAPVSVPIPQNNVPGVNNAPGWSWDTAERVLISDMDDIPDLATTITARSGAAPAQNVLHSFGEMDVMLQAMGGMACAPAASPEVMYHTGTELQQLNPAWFPHVEHSGRHHQGGAGVYFLGTDHGAGPQTQGSGGYVDGPMMVGPVQHPEYQLMPAVAPPVATWTDVSAIVPAAHHPADAWGAVYYV